MTNKKTDLVAIQDEITNQLANKEVFTALVNITFKGLNVNLVKRALMEGMMRGFTFNDFLEKNVYAIPFKDTYSLVTSIDYARKLGMRSGVCGTSKPEYEDDEKIGKIISCTITVKRKVDDYVGDYTATVYFDEYTTGYNLWKSKPRTMIAKVAEMHALRKACPEELSQAYVEEEINKETAVSIGTAVIPDEVRQAVESATTEEELKEVWEKNKGLGKDFAKMVVDQKNFIKSVIKDEHANS